MFDDQLNDLDLDLIPLTFGETPMLNTGNTSKTQTSPTATNEHSISLPNFPDSSEKDTGKDGQKKRSPHSETTLKAGLAHALHVRGTVESELMKLLKKRGQVSRQQYNEVKAEASNLAARAVNSIRTAWEEEESIRRPDCLVSWTQNNVPPLANITYLGSEKHPQMSYRRARIGGVTPGDLMDARIEFEDIYGMEYGSIKARTAFEVLMTGVQHNMRWEPELSVIPALSLHYRMDAQSRTYALAAHRADMPLILSSVD
jgi:hypothetical protein